MALRDQGEDLTGRTFNRLTVIRRTETRKSESFVWLCHCSCGNTCLVRAKDLQTGHVKSCGCLRSEIALEKLPKMKDKAGYEDGTAVSMLDTKMYSTNKSGHIGVSWDKNANKYTAQITFKRKKYHLGCFNDSESASKAYLLAKSRMHGEFLEWYYLEHPENKQIGGENNDV